jgi:nucleoside-diphosphate-sugar epimerase
LGNAAAFCVVDGWQSSPTIETMSRILVTGAAGYVGSILCEHLLAAGHAVTALDNLSHGEQALFHLCSNPAFELEVGDVRDEPTLRRLLRSADAVIPLAAVVGAPPCARDPTAARAVNLEAIQLLGRLRNRDQLVVFPTTNSGYGTRTGGGFCTEETPLEPVSLYGQTKVQAEAEVLSWPNTISLRLATVFGMSPRMRLDLLVNHFVWKAVTDGYIVIFEKAFRRNFVHIRDVADCFLHCLADPRAMVGRPFNLGLDSCNISKEELAIRIKEMVPGYFIHFAAVGTDPDRRDYLVSSRRLREAGFEAKRTLEEGVRELLKGYRLLGRGRHQNS